LKFYMIVSVEAKIFSPSAQIQVNLL
jgi:hypothetical protein